MNGKQIIGTILISAVVSVGIYLFMDYRKQAAAELDEPEYVDEPETETPHTEEKSKEKTPAAVLIPDPKKPGIFQGLKKKVGETVVTKKLLNEIEDRDIFISISLPKK